MNYLVFDIENTNSLAYGRKAGNFMVDKIVAVGYKAYDAPFAYTDNNLTYSHLSAYKVLIGHNIKHDLLFIWKDKGFQDWLKQGGKIWDTQLVEYILTGQETKYAALRNIAVHKYGCKERVKIMEDYWEKGFDTDEIPIELVEEDVKNDVLDTETIFLQQYKKVKELNLLNLIEFEMEALLATCEMEWNGIKVNKEVFTKNRTLLEKDINQLEKDLLKISEKYFR